MSQRSPFNERNMPKGGESGEEAKTSGMTKKSMSQAKPARPAAETVRVAPSSSKGKAKAKAAAKPLTKEERKAKRRAEREEQDQVANITELVMKQDPEYLKRRRVWWALLGSGMVLIIVTFVIVTVYGNSAASYDFATTAGKVSTVAMILSYAVIIAAFVWEFAKIRPLRNEAIRKVRGMNAKRRRAVIEASYEQQEKRRAEKAARKAAKK